MHLEYRLKRNILLEFLVSPSLHALRKIYQSRALQELCSQCHSQGVGKKHFITRLVKCFTIWTLNSILPIDLKHPLLYAVCNLLIRNFSSEVLLSTGLHEQQKAYLIHSLREHSAESRR